MKCPKCGNEMKIAKVAYKQIDGKFCIVQKVICDNPNCEDAKNVVIHETVHELPTE